MLIINENELIHTDDFNDVIEHYGIRGMKWGIRSRHSNLKESHAYYKKLDKQASDISPAIINPKHSLYNLAIAKSYDAAANKAIYKSMMYETLLKEKQDRAKRKGKKLKEKVARKLQDKADDKYYDYLANNKFANQYYYKHNRGY